MNNHHSTIKSLEQRLKQAQQSIEKYEAQAQRVKNQIKDLKRMRTVMINQDEEINSLTGRLAKQARKMAHIRKKFELSKQTNEEQ